MFIVVRVAGKVKEELQGLSMSVFSGLGTDSASPGFGVSGGWAATTAQPPLTPKRSVRSAVGVENAELELWRSY